MHSFFTFCHRVTGKYSTANSKENHLSATVRCQYVTMIALNDKIQRIWWYFWMIGWDSLKDWCWGFLQALLSKNTDNQDFAAFLFIFHSIVIVLLAWHKSETPFQIVVKIIKWPKTMEFDTTTWLFIVQSSAFLWLVNHFDLFVFFPSIKTKYNFWKSGVITVMKNVSMSLCLSRWILFPSR